MVNVGILLMDNLTDSRFLQKFNEELEDIANVLEDRRYKSDVFGASRPSHPTPEGQLRRKLKVAVKECYYWRQKSGYVVFSIRNLVPLKPSLNACHSRELTREIESLKKGVISP
jgi:hypothetical protein